MLERIEVAGRWEPGLDAGDVEAHDAPVAPAHGELGDLEAARGRAHRREQGAHGDRSVPRALLEAVERGLDDLVERGLAGLYANQNDDGSFGWFGARSPDDASRSGGSAEMTSYGVLGLVRAEQALAAVEDLQRAARSLSGHIAGRLRIGTVSDPEFLRLGAFLGRTLQRFPRLELELHHEVSGAALDALRDALDPYAR